MFKSRFRQYGYESSRLRRLSPTTNVTLTNLVSNGDFSNGTTGWTAYRGNGSVADNTYKLTADGTQLYAYVFQSIAAPTIGRLYALTFRVRVTNENCRTLRYRYGTAVTVDIQNPVNNTWYQRTIIITANSTYSDLTLYQYYVDADTANGKVMEVQYVSCVDITALEAALGRAITDAQMAMIMNLYDGWFNGSVNLSWFDLIMTIVNSLHP